MRMRRATVILVCCTALGAATILGALTSCGGSDGGSDGGFDAVVWVTTNGEEYPVEGGMCSEWVMELRSDGSGWLMQRPYAGSSEEALDALRFGADKCQWRQDEERLYVTFPDGRYDWSRHCYQWNSASSLLEEEEWVFIVGEHSLTADGKDAIDAGYPQWGDQLPRDSESVRPIGQDGSLPISNSFPTSADDVADHLEPIIDNAIESYSLRSSPNHLGARGEVLVLRSDYRVYGDLWPFPFESYDPNSVTGTDSDIYVDEIGTVVWINVLEERKGDSYYAELTGEKVGQSWLVDWEVYVIEVQTESVTAHRLFKAHSPSKKMAYDYGEEDYIHRFVEEPGEEVLNWYEDLPVRR